MLLAVSAMTGAAGQGFSTHRRLCAGGIALVRSVLGWNLRFMTTLPGVARRSEVRCRRRPASMPSLILSSFSHDPRTLSRELGIPEGLIHGRDGDSSQVIRANTPYLLGGRIEPSDWSILENLASWSVAAPLTTLSTTCGGDTTLALAGLIDDLHAIEPYALSAAGSAASTFTSRMKRFHSAVGEYESAMIEYRDASRWRRQDGPRAIAARQRLDQAGDALSRGFATELEASSRHMALQQRELFARDGNTALRVRKTRHVARLNIRSPMEASALARMARSARWIGPMALAFDFTSRAADVYAEAQAGGDWERKAVVEGAGFAAGAIASSVTTWAGGSMVTVAVMTGPVGWTLLVGSLAVITAATVAGAVFEDRVRKFAESEYDAKAQSAERKP